MIIWPTNSLLLQYTPLNTKPQNPNEEHKIIQKITQKQIEEISKLENVYTHLNGRGHIVWVCDTEHWTTEKYKQVENIIGRELAFTYSEFSNLDISSLYRYMEVLRV